MANQQYMYFRLRDAPDRCRRHERYWFLYRCVIPKENSSSRPRIFFCESPARGIEGTLHFTLGWVIRVRARRRSTHTPFAPLAPTSCCTIPELIETFCCIRSDPIRSDPIRSYLPPLHLFDVRGGRPCFLRKYLRPIRKLRQ